MHLQLINHSVTEKNTFSNSVNTALLNYDIFVTPQMWLNS